MALNSSGAISLAGSTTGQSIAIELSLGQTTQISLNDAAVRTLAGVASGAITMPTNFWGKSNSTYVVYGVGVAPYLQAWTWAAGWGTKFSDPAGMPSNSQQASLNPTNTAVACASTGTPFMHAYAWSGTTGFGTKYAAPSGITGAGTGRGAVFNKAGNVVMHQKPDGGAPMVWCWAWTDASGFGTKFANPATAVAASGGGYPGSGFNSTDSFVIIGHTATPYISTYNWTNASGFGTKWANTSPLTSNSTSNCLAANNSAFARTGVLQTDWSIFALNSTSYGTKYAAAPSPPTTYMASLQFNYAVSAFAICHNVSPFLTVYNWSPSGYGSKYANPATAAAQGNFLGFSRGDSAIIISLTNTPYQHAYAWSNATGFGSKYANPATLPANTLNMGDFKH
jgi:hypothetical protein